MLDRETKEIMTSNKKENISVVDRNMTGNFQSHRKVCVEDTAFVKCIKSVVAGTVARTVACKEKPKTTVK